MAFPQAATVGQIRAAKILLFCLCLIPLGHLVWRGFADALGANPVETIQRATGDWAFRLLLVTLAVTPLRRYSGWHCLVRLRRMLGLFSFTYVCLHLTTWAWLDNSLDFRLIAADVLKRPYVTVGFAAFLLMTPLAATSTSAMVRRLGGKRWQSLHRTVYVIAIGGLLHRWWLAKEVFLEPAIYTLTVVHLLGIRAWWREQKRRRQIEGAYGFEFKQAPKG